MKAEAERLLDEVHDSKDDIFEVSAWKDKDGDYVNVFSIITTEQLEEEELEIDSGMQVIVSRCSKEDLLNYIPEDFNDSVYLKISPPHRASSSETRRTTDVRVTRRSSEDMLDWGSDFPALCFEYWPKGPTRKEWDPQELTPLTDVLSERYGIRLDRHHERLGNHLVVIEDRRAKVHHHESSEDGIVEQLHEDSSVPTEESLLELADGWRVNLQQVSKDEVDVVVRSEEYGDLLHEELLDFDETNEVTNNEAAEFARNRNFNSVVAVTDGTGTTRYRTPQYIAPGSSDQICTVRKNGLTLDQASVDIVRGFEFNVNVMTPGSTSEPEIPVPTQIFAESDYKMGPPAWEEQITDFGPTIATNTWVIETDEDYTDVLQELYSRFSSTVKIMDPYLRPDDLSMFIEEASPDAEFWILVGYRTNDMDSMRSDFEDCIDEANDKGIEMSIRWVPGDQSTPIHDRFVLTSEGGLSIGTSFNSLESNLSIMYELRNDDSRNIENNFDTWYSNPEFAEEYGVETIGSTE
ncbi:hypothetical protein [Halococcus thailandensis]|uniref:hypothetical protein n=1 Tax=Halococcus thailandensis TaxID=335952 RepID=UPI000B29ACBF|nr:hypothetical protein [Halococcus thailandensis]